MNGQPSISELAEAIDVCLLGDRRRFRRRLRRLKSRGDAGARERGLLKLQSQVLESMKSVDRRRQLIVRQSFTGDLPILDARDRLAEAITNHPVVIVCGETGSGKTTQLPRICVDIGRGLFGLIGHTQPRRLAARAVAQRIAEEMGPNTPVGFQVRFRRDVPRDTIVKVMTDGILLSELSQDLRLEQYDTIIIDEAHERSLNIDLLLGCLRRIIDRRPELRVIVTSATIDADRFSEFFDGAPVIEVSGRQFPVDIVHADSGDSPEDPESVSNRVCTAMKEVLHQHPREGDVLVFLPGEREIREVARRLSGPFGDVFEIVPLYARLSLAAQQKALRPGHRRRIVLATNVAETSLTVPRIRVVIDSGLARINRYSARRGVERLPVEGISRASANQRAGRAGRLAPGTCLRLYSEAALNRRDEFTAPEILRTNLASLILRLADLDLGRIEDFPLLDRPRPAAIRAGLDTLYELGALDDGGCLTSVGRSMARLPVDPRVARMLLAGLEEDCLRDVLVIASALAVPDPRLRPPGEEQAADQRHAAFQVEGSDFLSFRVLWQAWVKTIRSTSSRRRWCKANFLSWIRMREWREIHDQLHRMLRESGIRAGRGLGDDDAIHRTLLTGLVTNIGNLARPRLASGGSEKIEKGVYEGPDRRRFRIHPSSGQSRVRPPWIMAAEIVETNRLWARTVAGIDPAWIASAAAHLLQPVHGDPEWDEDLGAAVTTEQRTLRGLLIPGSRRVSYAGIDPYVARRMFIDEGLVRGDVSPEAGFLAHNRRLQDEIERREARLRRRDLLASELDRAAFYESRLPEHVVDLASMTAWLSSAPPEALAALEMTEADLLRRSVKATGEAFPDRIELAGQSCQVRYGFEPGAEEDGLCVTVPLALLPGLESAALDWLVPGLLDEKIEAIIRGLDKVLRRACQPVGETVDWCRDVMDRTEARFPVAMAQALAERTGLDVTPAMIAEVEIPAHLVAVIEVVDGDRVVARGRDPEVVRAEHGHGAAAGFQQASGEHPRTVSGLQTWSFDGLLESVMLDIGGTPVTAWTALVDEGDSVGVRLVASQADAMLRSRRGLCRLFLLNTGGSVRFQVDHLPDLDRIALSASVCLSGDRLRDGLAMMACESIFIGEGGIRDITDAKAFQARLDECAGGIAQGVLESGSFCHTLFEQRQQVAIILESGHPPGAEVTWQEEWAHLQRLFPADLLHETPRGWLMQYPRWLELVATRLGRARRDVASAHGAEEVARWERLLAEAWQGEDTGPTLRQMAWLLEEWRVKVYAGGQPQAVPVTEETLQAQWEEVRHVLAV